MTALDSFHPVSTPVQRLCDHLFSRRSATGTEPETEPETGPYIDARSDINSAPGIRLAEGQFLAAGLTWEKLTALSDLPQIGTAKPRLRHGNRIARAPDRAMPSQAGSLLLALGAGLLSRLKPDERGEGVWLFTAQFDDAQDHSPPQSPSQCWTALAELKQRGSDWMTQPLPRAEALHDSPATAIDAISEHMATVDLAGIAICICAPEPADQRLDALPVNDFNTALTQGLPEMERGAASIVREIKPHPEGLPVFKAPFNVSVRTAGIASLAGAGLVAATLTLPQLVAAAFRAPPSPAPEFVPVAPEPGGFARACVSGLSDWWPRITGWQAAGGGCTLPRHLPPGLDVRVESSRDGTLPVIIWQRLKLSSTTNAVLAQEAATQVLAGWTGGKSISADQILLWKTASIPLVEMDPEGAPVPADTTRAHLAAIWAHLPNAVRAADASGSDLEAASNDGFIIQAPDAPADLFARAARVAGLEPVRLDLSTGGQGNEGSGNTLHLSPVTPRLVPKGTETNRVPVSPTSVQGTSP